MKNLGLIPLRNFAIVDKGIYRSAQPIYGYEYKWLKKVLNVDTIINLRKESVHDEHNAPSHFIHVHSIPVVDHLPPTLEQAQEFIDLIKESSKNNKSVLFHCEHGHGRTSTFCVLARIAQGWSLKKALKEEEEKFHYAFKHKIQKDFLLSHFK